MRLVSKHKRTRSTNHTDHTVHTHNAQITSTKLINTGTTGQFYNIIWSNGTISIKRDKAIAECSFLQRQMQSYVGYWSSGHGRYLSDEVPTGYVAVSYTHLDVYKRQV